MHTVSWSPWPQLSSEMARLRDEILRRSLGPGNGSQSRVSAAYPQLNLWVDTERLYIEAELPGLDLADLELEVAGDQLSLKGTRREPEMANGSWYRRERAYGKFHRVLDLPVAVDPDHVQARLKNGVLRIELPKPAQDQPRRIEIEAT